MTSALILASGSSARAKMLRDAGVTLEIIKPAVDEDELKASYRAEGADVIDTAIALAEMKAQAVSRRHNGRYILGADQMLECEGIWFDKPADIGAARAQLMTRVRGDFFTVLGLPLLPVLAILRTHGMLRA